MTTSIATLQKTQAYGARVYVEMENHRRNGQSGIIVNLLPNPSGRTENQWYDIRFDDGLLARFNERHLSTTDSQSGTPKSTPELTLDFSTIHLNELPKVGGKNASLGEMFNVLRLEGIGVVDGFATTAFAYRKFLAQSNLEFRLQTIFQNLDVENVQALSATGHAARTAILETPIPTEIQDSILDAHRRLCKREGADVALAVRSSATAEDLPEASFAGAAETFLNVRGSTQLLDAVHKCFASLFTDRAISYRARLGYGQLQVALSVGIMPMIRSDMACAGVIFTLDTETGFRDAVVITGAYGLGEYVVQGVVTPDEWTVFKPTLQTGHEAIIGRQLGSKEVQLVFGDGSRTTKSEPTPVSNRQKFCLADSEVAQLARWACTIESHYSNLAGQPRPMDIEWAKDGLSGKLYIVQARPETVHSAKPRSASAEVYRLKKGGESVLVRGQAVGEKVGCGNVRVVLDAADLGTVRDGDVLVAAKTDPDWEPVMRRVAAIVTDQGGRTAHAAIVSREFGVPCIVGSGNATRVLTTGTSVTVSCCEGAEGRVYSGRVPFEIERIDASKMPQTKTQIMLTVGDPSQAFVTSAIPNCGVGLARTEFIITNHIGIHPMALARFPKLSNSAAVEQISRRLNGENPADYFVNRFSEGVARIAAAFYPKPVIVRTSDFKTNEYARLLGGEEFEPAEENPMLGFRGASRYYAPEYADGFALECRALLRVRREMGLHNVKVMIPFCRTVAEGKRVIQEMAKYGLTQGADGLEVYAMCELPSNVILANEFLQVFDGFSIGSNDLTQLVLGIDRDSGTVAHLFDKRNDAVLQLISQAIQAVRHWGKPIGICGQAPSDYPEFAAWLVTEGITSISVNPDVAIKTAITVAESEQSIAIPPRLRQP